MKNFLHNATFITSSVSTEGFVSDTGREVCFIGRSNAGKSSAINALCDNQKLVKTSKTPGRTQAINFFEIANDKRLVDLPGYGFASVSNKKREHWDTLLDAYFSERESLHCVFVIVDIRRGLGPMDIKALSWLRKLRPTLALHILLTKSDKIGRAEEAKTLRETEATIASRDDDAMTVRVFSATKGVGLDQARAKLRSHL